jgi:NAD(P)-dependent dehydrogenase (short-subunit alcohol dehydrogenase family)
MKILENRIAVITGASRGIGRAVAVAYAQAGARLILLGRDVAALEETDDLVQAAGGEATLVPCDFGKPDVLDALAPEMAKKFGRVDIFVGNAATLGTLSPLADIKPRDFVNVMTVNCHAHWRLLRALHGGLLASPAGRVIFTTSGVTQFNPAYWGAYTISKSALEAMALTYAAEVKNTKIRCNLIDPGVVRTQLRAAAFPGENPDTLPLPETVADLYVNLASAQCAQNGERVCAADRAQAA